MNGFFRKTLNLALFSSVLIHAGVVHAAPKPKKKLPPSPPVLSVSDFRVPTTAEISQTREQERWACVRRAGLSPPTSRNCPNCGPTPDGGDPVNPHSPELANWIAQNLRDLNLVQGCDLPQITITSTEERVDRQSCPPKMLEAMRNSAHETSRFFVRAATCLERLNPVLFRLTDAARRELGNPIYSCYEDGDSQNLKFWEDQCRARLKDPSSPRAAQSVEACVQVFKNSQRITIQHPVFPDRWVLRLSKDTYETLAAPSVSARVQIRDLFARSGLGADSALADGCLGTCGPMPGSAYVASMAGCERCASYGQDGVAATNSARSCNRLALDSLYRGVAEFQNFEECSAAIRRGDNNALARACARLQKVEAYQVYCKKISLDPAVCLKNRDAEMSLRTFFARVSENSLRILGKQDDWTTRLSR